MYAECIMVANMQTATDITAVYAAAMHMQGSGIMAGRP